MYSLQHYTSFADAYAEQADAVLQDYHRNHADYRSDDNSEDDEMFGSYHRYRALLDREEEENHRDDEEEDDESNVETVTPRRINDVSGMLRQFAQHSGTLPSVFTPPQGLPSGDTAFAQTWPNSSHHDLELERPSDAQKEENREEEEEEEDGEEEIESERLRAEQREGTDVLQHRNSFIDSWLEDSVEHKQDASAESQPQLLGSLQRLDDDHTKTVQQFELDLPNSDTEESAENTPRGDGALETESAPSEGKPPGGMHLLSNVELIDTLTSVNSVARRTRGGQKLISMTGSQQTNGNGGEQRNTTASVSAFSQFNGHRDQGLHHDRHLLSNVELYSTTSSFHPTARPPRHLLSNVELASTASGSSHHPDTASSRPSRQSSANSGGRRAELEVCAEVENSQDEVEFNQPQPVSARSDKVSDFFAASRQAAVMNGAYDSSEEELDYQFSAGARATAVKSRMAGKGREPCQSTTGTTEDSGLESGAKSSQDEREALSLLDSTQGHGQAEVAAVPEFFLPTEQLQASMRALHLATSAASHAQNQAQVSDICKGQGSAP